MSLYERGPKSLDRHMGIALSGVQRCVTEQLLNRTKIGTPLKDMSGRRVTKSVRGEPRATGISRDSFDDCAHGSLADSSTPAAHEQRRTRARDSMANLDPLSNGNCRRDAEGHDALLAPLAEHPHGSRIVIKVAKIDRAQLRHTDPGCVEQFDDGPIAQCARIAIIGHASRDVHDPGGLFGVENGRQPLRDPRAAQPLPGV